MTNQKIVDYVINTPNNTNPAILKQMLKDIAGSGGNVDVTIDGETLVIAENSTATIKNETLIL